MRNNPVLYNDPTGHKESCEDGDNCQHSFSTAVQNVQYQNECKKGKHSCVTGGQIQITLAVGMPTETYGINQEKISPLLFYGLSIVFDKYGGIQLYGLTRDVKFSPYLEQGPAELKYPMNLGSAGISISGGLISGSDFGLKGTDAYEGRAIDNVVGLGPITYDHYDMFDRAENDVDPERLRGDDIGLSFGFPASLGAFATYAHRITPRLGFPVP